MGLVGLGNGLVPWGNKPLPESMLTQIFGCHVASLGHNGLKWAMSYVCRIWKYMHNVLFTISPSILHKIRMNNSSIYHKTSNISRTLVGNKILDHSDAVGASPVGTATTTSPFSTQHLASRDSARTAARQYENLLSVGICCVLY